MKQIKVVTIPRIGPDDEVFCYAPGCTDEATVHFFGEPRCNFHAGITTVQQRDQARKEGQL